MEKKRIIVDYSTLPDEVLEIMADTYPDGYDHDIFRFNNAKGEVISAVRIETEDTIYLVKVSKQLKELVDEYEDYDDADGDDDDDFEEKVSSSIAKNKVPKYVIPDEELEEDEEDEDDEEYDVGVDNYDDEDDDEDDDL